MESSRKTSPREDHNPAIKRPIPSNYVWKSRFMGALFVSMISPNEKECLTKTKHFTKVCNFSTVYTYEDQLRGDVINFAILETQEMFH